MNSTFYIDKTDVHINADIANISGRDDKVCVVAVVGKSPMSTNYSKATCLNPYIGTEVFRGLCNLNWVSSDNMCRVDGYYDTQKGVVFLHLVSIHDPYVMLQICHIVHDDPSQSLDYDCLQRSAEYTYLKALLFVFSVSHIVLVSHPGTTFDISYIRILQTLDAARLKLQPTLSEALKRSGISKDWIKACRPCSPRVLFVFEGVGMDPFLLENDVSPTKGRSSKICPIKELQHNLEDQIYRILRKARIITNTSNNSLFAVPQNQEFVFIRSKPQPTRDLVSFYQKKLAAACSSTGERETSRSKSYQLSRRKDRTTSKEDQSSSSREAPQHSSADGAQRSVSVDSSASSLGTPADETDDFSEFLSRHVNLALTKGFDDNVGRNPVPAFFELPSLSSWFTVVNKLHAIFWSEEIDPKVLTHFSGLRSMLDIDIRFSDGHCKKVLPIAENAYTDGLPPLYTSSFHQNKMAEAVKVFSQHARGPACDKYIAELKEFCTNMWKDGRQMCEEISLTGNHCINELHRLPDMPETESTKHLPVMAHSSQVKTKAACNCGRRQSERDDPFEHRMANHDFYQRLEQVCCGKLEHYDMTVFKPSATEEVRAAEAVVRRKLVSISESDPESPSINRKDAPKFDLNYGLSTLSLALDLGQSDGCNPFMNEAIEFHSDESPPDEDDIILTTDDEMEDEQMKTGPSDATAAPRQHSTTEYLPGMLHSDSLPRLLPKFPSWSLVLLGKYSSYNPSLGLDQPGFMHLSNFLLPLDITLRTEKDGEVGGKAARNETSTKKPKTKKDRKEFVQTVRLHVGLEYECSRGHRFFLSAPDKIFKAPASGTFKETGQRILSHDMPLYFPCSCRNPVQFMGQLTRVHVVVPESEIEVRLRPRVQPAPSPCPLFFPESSGDCLALKSGHWVLRLPFIYLGENGPFRIPSDAQKVSSCRFAKNFLSVVEASG